jgi:zinc protease
MEQHCAVAAGAWYQSTAVDQSRLLLYAIPHPGVSLDTLEKALDGVIHDVITNGIEAKELARAKTRLIADTIYAQDSQASLARMYGASLATGSTVNDVKSWPEAIDAVSAESVQAAAKAWLERRRAVTGYLLKEEVAA